MKRAAFLAGASLALAVGCSGGGEQKGDSAVVASAAPQEVTFTANDYSFSGPDTLSAGLTTIHLASAGQQIHHLQLVRLEDGKTFGDFQAAVQQMKPGMVPPAWMVDAGGPNPPQPGGTSTVTLDLQPGTYAVTCFVDTPDKVPHVAKGMMKQLVVTPNASAPAAAAAPAHDVELSLTDYAFGFSTPLTPGKHTIKVTNSAQQAHEIFLILLDPGKTPEDFGKWAATYQGPPPGKAMGGVSAIAPGQTVWIPVDLPAGDYMALCFVPDSKDGKPHIDHGMLLPFKVG